MTTALEAKLEELVRPLLASEGLELWGLRCLGGREHARLQIFVDRSGGVSAAQCGDAVDLLSPALDAADLIASAYTLEVSSPGLDRIFFRMEQLCSYTGCRIQAELRAPLQGRRRFSGILEAAGPDGILTIRDEVCGCVQVPFAGTSQVRLVPEFPKNDKPGFARPGSGLAKNARPAGPGEAPVTGDARGSGEAQASGTVPAGPEKPPLTGLNVQSEVPGTEQAPGDTRSPGAGSRDSPEALKASPETGPVKTASPEAAAPENGRQSSPRKA